MPDGKLDTHLQEHGCGDLHGSGHCERIVSPDVLLKKGCSTKVHLSACIPDDLAMDGAGDTVLQLQVHLGNGVFWEYGSVRDISDCS